MAAVQLAQQLPKPVAGLARFRDVRRAAGPTDESLEIEWLLVRKREPFDGSEVLARRHDVDIESHPLRRSLAAHVENRLPIPRRQRIRLAAAVPHDREAASRLQHTGEL